MNNLLSIGSIVLLKEGNKMLMIIGYCQADLEKQNVIYDYAGITYPEGYLTPDRVYLFNQDNIQSVIFNGYVDVNGQNFKNKVYDFQTKIKSGVSIEEAGKIFAASNNN